MMKQKTVSMLIAALVMMPLTIATAAEEPTPPSGKQTPVIRKVTTSIPAQGKKVQLPSGAGELRIEVDAYHAKEVRFWMVPNRKAKWKQRTFMYSDTSPKNGFVFEWKYEDKEYQGNVEIEVVGKDGTKWTTIQVDRGK
ncbi:hypothetical protein [Brevibacillus dissolubilis]|uniref:hypothetical protein n=1 Tax=Brevibacillus dissolubilis TaxID=1844116 RepID=UPI0011161E32|nr:hypothetical protein [Brevibacillus dissolubilis]